MNKIEPTLNRITDYLTVLPFDPDEEDFLEINSEREESKPVSLWIQNGDVITPSTDIKEYKQLNPGMYTVGFSRELGFFVKRFKIKSDELFIFSDSIVNKLLEEINLFWTKADTYKEANLVHKRGVLLAGPSGTGKSSIISILSNEIIAQGGVVFVIKSINNLEYHIDFIKNYFRKIQPNTPVITILEDLDKYESVEPDLLDFLDGKSQINHHILIATSNNTENIPDTLLRASRIDLIIEVNNPNAIIRREFFKYKNIPESDITTLVDKSEGLSLAELKELYICIYLLEYSLEESLEKILNPKKKVNYIESKVPKYKLGIG